MKQAATVNQWEKDGLFSNKDSRFLKTLNFKNILLLKCPNLKFFKKIVK